MMGFDSLETAEFAQLGGTATDGVLMSFQHKAEDDPKNAALVKKFRDAGYNPEGYTLFSYAAVTAWADAANKAKSTDAAAVAKALRGGTYNSAVGVLAFDQKGDIKNPVHDIYSGRTASPRRSIKSMFASQTIAASTHSVRRIVPSRSEGPDRHGADAPSAVERAASNWLAAAQTCFYSTGMSRKPVYFLMGFIVGAVVSLLWNAMPIVRAGAAPSIPGIWLDIAVQAVIIGLLLG